jgi:hypothetical protein
VTFNTHNVTVELRNEAGELGVLPDEGLAKYYASGWKSFGTTDSNGEATKELLPLSYKFSMKYGGATNYQTQNVGADPTVDFSPTKVEIISAETVKYYASGWKTISGPTYMLPGTYKFKIGNDYHYIDISGCNLTGGLLTLADEAGNPLANYPADYPGETRNLKYKYRCGGSWAPWTSFQTDANGQTFYNIDCTTVGSGNGNWDNKITMTLNQTSIEQDVTVNSIFQAAKVNVNLKTCNPETALAGGTVAQGGGYWYTHGTTDSSGMVSFYAFPGNNVKVRMDYNYKSVTENPVPVSTGVNDINFTTTTVNFFYGGTIKIQAGGWPTISTPIELLPGSYGFKFGNDLINVDVSGCELSQGLLTVVDENGSGVAGATFTPACGGSWQAGLPGATDVNGKLFTDIPACMTKIRAKVGNSSQEKLLADLNASNYTYTTEILRVFLKDHAGNPIADQTGSLDQGGGTWIGLGNFNASGYVDVQTFPVASARYRASYNLNFEIKDGIPVTAGPVIQEIDFQTGQVFGTCITQYQGAGWSPFTNGMEQMPGTRTFRYPSQSGTVTAGQVTYLVGCPGVYDSGTLDATYSSPTVTFNAYAGAPASGMFNIVYPDGSPGTYGEPGTTVTGDIVCLSFDGANAYLGGLVTQTNSSGGWQVGQYVRFGVSTTNLNFTGGEAAMPDCETDHLLPDLTLDSGGFTLIQ